jgi:tRNA uridine 5-carboxymethylaminomethyl modification enzyme
MFTSRAEFRLHLRIDNADRRLTPHGRRVGLISDGAWTDFQSKQERLERMKRLLESTRLSSAMLEQIMEGRVSSPVHAAEADGQGRTSLHESAIGQPLSQFLKRPEITIEMLVPALRHLTPAFFSGNHCPPATAFLKPDIRNELKSIETEIKYAGYLDQQERAIERLKKAEQRRIPDWFDYRAVSGLSREMQEKLLKVQPQTLGQASRIPGVTPAAVSLVNVYIEIQGRRREQAAAL